MNKGLDLIKRQQPEIIDGFPTGNIFIGVTKEELTELEKELKDYDKLLKDIFPHPKENGEEYRQLAVKRLLAFDIINEKEVDIYGIKNSIDVYDYNAGIENEDNFENRMLTEEEYNSVKEVML